MQMTHPFIVKVRHGEYVQAPRLRVSWRERMRVKRETSMFREIEHDSWDRSGLKVHATVVGETDADGRFVRTLVPVLRANGGHGQANQGANGPATAVGVKAMVRRLRPQEAEAIAAVDDEIASLEERIRQLRRDRKELVAKAWANGHVVRLSEVTPVGDDPSRYVDA